MVRFDLFNLCLSHLFFSSESVGEGHPDKVSDSISDSILDACMEQDPNSRVACETLVKSNCVTIAGEITTSSKFDYEDVVREAIREIGYVNDDDIFHADKVFITNQLTAQSRDIGQGVDANAAEGKGTDEQGAGDQELCLVMLAMKRMNSCLLLSCTLIVFSAKWLRFEKYIKCPMAPTRL